MINLSIDNLLNDHITPIPHSYLDFPKPPSPVSFSPSYSTQPQYSLMQTTKGETHALKNTFTEEEDIKLNYFVQLYGSNWQAISNAIGSKSARQCAEHCKTHLNPKLASNPWTHEEDMELVKNYAEYGSRWKKIAMLMPGRSVNSVRNRWKLLLKNTEKHTATQD